MVGGEQSRKRPRTKATETKEKAAIGTNWSENNRYYVMRFLRLLYTDFMPPDMQYPRIATTARRPSAYCRIKHVGFVRKRSKEIAYSHVLRTRTEGGACSYPCTMGCKVECRTTSARHVGPVWACDNPWWKTLKKAYDSWCDGLDIHGLEEVVTDATKKGADDGGASPVAVGGTEGAAARGASMVRGGAVVRVAVGGASRAVGGAVGNAAKGASGVAVTAVEGADDGGASSVVVGGTEGAAARRASRVRRGGAVVRAAVGGASRAVGGAVGTAAKGASGVAVTAVEGADDGGASSVAVGGAEGAVARGASRGGAVVRAAVGGASRAACGETSGSAHMARLVEVEGRLTKEIEKNKWLRRDIECTSAAIDSWKRIAEELKHAKEKVEESMEYEAKEASDHLAIVEGTCQALEKSLATARAELAEALAGGDTVKEAMALMLHFIHANSRPAQGHILEKVGEHAKKVGLTPPDGVEPLIYVGRPSAEQCDELHEYGSGSMRTIKFYTLPSGSKLNLHADGNGQHEDAFLATLGRPAKDGTPIAMLLVASPEVLGGSTNPLHTEFALLPCFPGSIITLSGRLAIGGNLSDSSKGYLHGKPPIDLMATSEATPHVVLACKRFKLRECDVRPEGAASESVMRPAGSIDYKNPLEAVYHRMYIIGPVAEEDAYAPLVESMRKRGDIWEPIDLHSYKQRARLQRGRHLWGPGMMVKHNTDLESLGLIPNIQFSPEVYMSRRIYKTPHKLLPRVIALVFSREEPRFMISSTGVHLDYDPSDTRRPTKRDNGEAWEESRRRKSLIRVFVGPHHPDRDALLAHMKVVVSQCQSTWWLYAADMRVTNVDNGVVRLESFI
ncbi:hypothetical protein CYMTET_51888 [Cymbomonas tetramitiformis]|uniref:Uncharacterized protein n=1 Tax=Cymbomonas tetramitiformis TaxID=36881 RepID=A0AAE0BLY3_9CHLO|nr:hypothetical protein CYMTET_51888 [Cymbomonas tetramitiformis]